MGSSVNSSNAADTSRAECVEPSAREAWINSLESLYCPSCGYNLRGQIGDPVRCPECGVQTTRQELIIPAWAITRALRLMEGSPTACVGCAIACLTCVGLASIPIADSPIVEMSLAALFALGWFAARARMRQVFGNQPGWSRVLRDFHIAALFAMMPLTVLVIVSATEFHGRGLFVAAPIAVVSLIVFNGVYTRARGDIERMQRAAAVGIAAGFVIKVR